MRDLLRLIAFQVGSEVSYEELGKQLGRSKTTVEKYLDLLEMCIRDRGNLAVETQQMLLRAIQERRYRPVGDKADRNFNCLLYTSRCV